MHSGHQWVSVRECWINVNGIGLIHGDWLRCGDSDGREGHCDWLDVACLMNLPKGC